MLSRRTDDPRWQLERSIAELISERRMLQFEIQQRYTQIASLNAKIVALQDELKIGEPS